MWRHVFVYQVQQKRHVYIGTYKEMYRKVDRSFLKHKIIDHKIFKGLFHSSLGDNDMFTDKYCFRLKFSGYCVLAGVTHLQKIIRIYHECEYGLEQSVPRITVWHHEACPLMAINGCE